MRTFVISVAVCAAVALSGAPAAAETVTVTLNVTDAGPVTSCSPAALIKFGGTITIANWPPGPRQIQFKWTFSDIGDQPTQSITLPSTGATTSKPVAFIAMADKSAGGWAQLVVSYPANVASNKVNWKLVCPNVGSLTVPVTLTPADLGPGLHLPH